MELKHLPGEDYFFGNRFLDLLLISSDCFSCFSWLLVSFLWLLSLFLFFFFGFSVLVFAQKNPQTQRFSTFTDVTTEKPGPQTVFSLGSLHYRKIMLQALLKLVLPENRSRRCLS